jgi:hypothetical protein
MEHSNHSQIAQTLFEKGLSEKEVQLEIQNLGVHETMAQELISHWKKLKYAARQKNGFFLLALGAFTCFLSCLLTMLHIFPDLTAFFLYGLTSLGVLKIMCGLFCVLE